ncbi:TetR/AcrR family transcriptional regulator [Nocardioides sp. B-3]|uniref:TetR/AcrR family transcriptional regulator n=1 Tax=Nocardioides sp. B-3 TaxID=2895565 RepID=UPI00215221E4|nr:TetR/AcrR family transcriptional regulator [Nocardioides sp. B-3]UUZ61460.1 TetR/AcrR family transcriptional regulator [Nocardioides sp. B-3]
MADLAEVVGVSRQTIYNEFGSKDDLVPALYEREKDRFIAGFEERMDAGESLDVAMRASIMWMLDEVVEHRVLTRMVADARAGSTDGLIPLLTVHSDAIVKPVREQVVQLLLERWPKLDREAVEVSTEHTVRFIPGQLVTPTDLDRGRMVDGILAMTTGPPARARQLSFSRSDRPTRRERLLRTTACRHGERGRRRRHPCRSCRRRRHRCSTS